jgi:hypothetical protein
MLSKTLTMPRFSATNTRPSGENRIAVGLVRPEITVVSWNPLGSVVADARAEPMPRTTARLTAATTHDMTHERVIRFRHTAGVLPHTTRSPSSSPARFEPSHDCG